MATYHTPGVYVEEISVLPASVASVESAVPVFIGNTERFPNGRSDGPPVKITSIREFESIFGLGPELSGSRLVLDTDYSLVEHDFGIGYYLYEAIRMFYQNGGGECYVVSTGTYADEVSAAALIDGIARSEKNDAITLLCVPDTLLLTATEASNVQQRMLSSCGELGDRFALFDLQENHSWQMGIDQFRDGIGVVNLKYGAAYTPHIEFGAPKKVSFEEIDGSLQLAGAGKFDIALATAEPTVISMIASLRASVAVSQSQEEVFLNSASDLILGIEGAYAENLNVAWGRLTERLGNPQKRRYFKNQLIFLYELFLFVEHRRAEAVAAGNPTTFMIATLPGQLKNLIEVDNAAEADAPGLNDSDYPLHGSEPGGRRGNTDAYADLFTDGFWSTVNFASSGFAGFTGASTLGDKISAAQPVLEAAFAVLRTAMADLETSLSIDTTGPTFFPELEAQLIEAFPLYKKIFQTVSSMPIPVPPSGAMAGIYARVDKSRGVWKAPANVTVMGATGVTEVIDDAIQAGLNVDALAGKSINAIRFFRGKGIIVWGSRTLAGNDNEWRYIPVRRLFLVIEESLKQATEAFVFEANDSKTWTRLKGMAGNFLRGYWQQGALAGAKPEEAYFVKCGLGETMTSQDILEGRLIVEIGLAAVRPAEFIILRFMHKLQES